MSVSAPSRVDARELNQTFLPGAGEDIYVEVTGRGETVVLCHGLGGNHAIWWRQVDAFAARFELVTWDQRGFGNSTARTGRVGIGEAATDLLAVLESLDVQRIHLIGQSMGAFVALRFAHRHPERLRSLVLSTTLAGADPRFTRALGAAVPPKRLRDSHPVLSAQFCRARPDLAILYNQISSFGAKPPIAAMLEAMASEEITDTQLAAIECPALVVAAEHDPLCTPDLMRATADRMPTARYAVLAGAGHSAYYENPAAWNQLVLDFLNSATPGS
jgi:3-oxoadipate enol-lactonase